jgi:hypothetical protein
VEVAPGVGVPLATQVLGADANSYSAQNDTFDVLLHWQGFVPNSIVNFDVCEANRSDARCAPIGGSGTTNGQGSGGDATFSGTVTVPVAPSGFQCNLAADCAIRVHDSNDPTIFAVAPLTISPVAGPPFSTAPRATLNDDNLVASQNQPSTLDVLANDQVFIGNSMFSGTGNLIVTGWSRPHHGDVNCDNAGCTYTPDAGFAGDDTFRYQASMFGLAQAPVPPYTQYSYEITEAATVTVTVSPDAVLPEAPIAILLPGSGLLAIGAVLALGRRRHSRMARSGAL